jgi:hypothetical protein
VRACLGWAAVSERLLDPAAEGRVLRRASDDLAEDGQDRSLEHGSVAERTLVDARGRGRHVGRGGEPGPGDRATPHTATTAAG